MSAEAVLAEALARVEYKLDVLHAYFSKTDPARFLPLLAVVLGSKDQTCTACGQPVEHQIDFMNQVVTRKCGCSTGKLAPIDLGAFAPPVLPAREIPNGGSGDQQEDRYDAPRRGGTRKR